MSTSLLYYENPSLSIEERWLLWQWSQRIGIEQAVTCSVRELGEQLGMTLRQVQKALTLLKEKGFIIATSQPNGRGRPSYEYLFSSLIKEKLLELAYPESAFLKLVKQLGNVDGDRCDVIAGQTKATTPVTSSYTKVKVAPLQHSNESSAHEESLASTAYDSCLNDPIRKTSLSLASRWVLMVKLAHADLAGTVVGLSHRRLQHLTGLSLSGLRDQRGKLFELGILAEYHFGRGSGRGVKDSNKVSYYRFDLGHPIFDSQARLAIQLTILPTRKESRSTALFDGIVDAMFVAAQAISDPEQSGTLASAEELLPPLSYIEPLAGWLVKEYNAASAAWLLERVHFYAISLLSTVWQRLAENKAGPKTPVEVIFQKIYEELPKERLSIPLAPHITIDSPCEDEANQLENENIQEKHSLIATLIYALAHHVALELQYDLGKLMFKHGYTYSSLMDFHIVPFRSDPTSLHTETLKYRPVRLCGFVSRDHPDAFKKAEVLIIDYFNRRVFMDLGAQLRRFERSSSMSKTAKPFLPHDAVLVLASKTPLGLGGKSSPFK
ncbi:hypothetical protein [Vreelandella populi]|uniref:Uncharacterized protein n=1 Tax=Vreelandella populi TaxID=2498858 RepID=A0A433L897_9GAMM|nr:hypothetical protein [Halomonas populi]RUR43430.1 hypothetical protein ELY37_17145 [Halomonas populi]